jgi:hypothetical protein
MICVLDADVRLTVPTSFRISFRRSWALAFSKMNLGISFAVQEYAGALSDFLESVLFAIEFQGTAHSQCQEEDIWQMS